jgi:hypothetical protein
VELNTAGDGMTSEILTRRWCVAGEEWARRIVQKELKRTVKMNDDGRRDSMYDLRIGSVDAPEVAIECVGAVDSVFTETWNLGPAKGPLSLEVQGDWNVEIATAARVKTVRQNLQRLLKELESQRTHNVTMDYRLRWVDPGRFNELESLGIAHAHCYRVQGSGKVHLSLPGTGGAVDKKGSEVPKWLGDFLRARARADVLSKLERSGASVRHACVIANLAGVPWSVGYYFMGELDVVPGESPKLPPPVNAAWVVPDFGQKGLYWDGTCWRVVDAVGEGIDD